MYGVGVFVAEMLDDAFNTSVVILRHGVTDNFLEPGLDVVSRSVIVQVMHDRDQGLTYSKAPCFLLS